MLRNVNLSRVEMSISTWTGLPEYVCLFVWYVCVFVWHVCVFVWYAFLSVGVINVCGVLVDKPPEISCLVTSAARINQRGCRRQALVNITIEKLLIISHVIHGGS